MRSRMNVRRGKPYGPIRTRNRKIMNSLDLQDKSFASIKAGLGLTDLPDSEADQLIKDLLRNCPEGKRLGSATKAAVSIHIRSCGICNVNLKR